MDDMEWFLGQMYQYGDDNNNNEASRKRAREGTDFSSEIPTKRTRNTDTASSSADRTTFNIPSNVRPDPTHQELGSGHPRLRTPPREDGDDSAMDGDYLTEPYTSGGHSSEMYPQQRNCSQFEVPYTSFFRYLRSTASRFFSNQLFVYGRRSRSSGMYPQQSSSSRYEETNNRFGAFTNQQVGRQSFNHSCEMHRQQDSKRRS